MPIFFLTFSDQRYLWPNDLGLEFASLEHAYLQVCAAIPEVARDLLADRQDPLTASCDICDDHGRVLMTVPFTDVLSASAERLGGRCPGPRDKA